jgi:hypothetical protein
MRARPTDLWLGSVTWSTIWTPDLSSTHFASLAHDGRFVLVLSQREDHLGVLGQLLGDAGLEQLLLVGAVGRKHRRSVIEDQPLGSGPGDARNCVAASSL